MLDMSRTFDTVVRAIIPKEPIKHNWQQKKTVRSKLETRNPNVKETKTEQYQIKWNENELWKECKLIGSSLDTNKQISPRK